MPLFRSSENARSELFEGGYYSIADGDEFAIAKVLKLDPKIVHVRIFKEHFARRPRSIDPGQLTLGKGPRYHSVGHVPFRLKSFQKKEPVFITHSAVEVCELEGYEVWKDAEGGVWE